MHADAYGTEVDLEGDVLTITATSAIGKGALGGGQRVIPLTALQQVHFKAANPLVNGQLELLTAEGKTIVHFRRKQGDAVRSIYEALISNTPGAVTPEHIHAPLASTVRTAQVKAANAAEREHLQNALEVVRQFRPMDAAEAAAEGIMLAHGECLYLAIEGASCVEIRHARGAFRGRSQGVSFRVAKGVSYRVGGSRGTYVPGPEAPTSIDVGTVLVTDRRIIFRGQRESREWKFANLTGVEHSDDGAWTALPVTNRQKTSGIGYGTEVADDVRLRLQIALADFHGSREPLTQQIQQRLDDLSIE